MRVVSCAVPAGEPEDSVARSWATLALEVMRRKALERIAAPDPADSRAACAPRPAAVQRGEGELFRIGLKAGPWAVRTGSAGSGR